MMMMMIDNVDNAACQGHCKVTGQLLLTTTNKTTFSAVSNKSARLLSNC